jgi:intracellular septation protein
MSDKPSAPANENAPQQKGGGHLLVDLGPVGVFMVAYNLANRFAAKGEAIFWATGLFVVATLVALAYAWFVQKRAPWVLIFTAAVVLLFGGLTMALHDPIFIKIKPTVVYLFYAAVIFGGLIFKHNIWKRLFAGSLTLPDDVWRTLAIRWGGFFIVMAGLNEFVWRNFSEATWVNFKFFGAFPLIFLFGLANAPLMMKHTAEPDKNDPPAS